MLRSRRGLAKDMFLEKIVSELRRRIVKIMDASLDATTDGSAEVGEPLTAETLRAFFEESENIKGESDALSSVGEDSLLSGSATNKKSKSKSASLFSMTQASTQRDVNSSGEAAAAVVGDEVKEEKEGEGNEMKNDKWKNDKVNHRFYPRPGDDIPPVSVLSVGTGCNCVMM